MAGKKSLDRATYKTIVAKLRAGTSRAAVAEETGQPTYVVGKVAAAAGLGKIRPDFRRADKTIVDGWLAAGASPRRRRAS